MSVKKRSRFDKNRFVSVQAVLTARKAECIKGLISWRKTLAEIRSGQEAGDDGDLADVATFCVEESFQIGRLEACGGLIRRIDAAIFSIQNGSYGVCEFCEEPISDKRLEAVPWTSKCLKCAEAAEAS